MTYKKRDHPKNQGGLFFGIAFERYFYSESAVVKIAVHATPIWWSRGESIQSRVRSVEPSRTALFMRGCGELFCIYRRSPASAKQWNLPRTKKCPPDTFYTSVRTGAVLSIPTIPIHKRNDHQNGGHFFYGGAEGNRTPVRRQLDKTFSVRRRLFTFPLPGGNSHPQGISSFMMHGTRKA